MLDTRHRLFFVHGIGTSEPEQSYGRLVQRLIQAWGGDPEHFRARFRVDPIDWSGVTKEAKTELFRRSFAHEPIELNARIALSPILSLRTFMTIFIGDAVAYVDEGDNGIRKAFWEQLRKSLSNEELDAGASFSIIAHSLGSVIAYDFAFHLFEGGKLFDPVPETALPIERMKAAFRGLYTMGSPIGLFFMRKRDLWQDGRPFQSLKNPMAERTWLNFYDYQDIIAYPLSELFPNSPPRDVKVGTGDLIINSHLGYWSNGDVAREIVEQLRAMRLPPGGA